MKSSDYRSIIQAEFTRRKQLNSRYSLRAFARDIGLSPAFLSKLLSGQKDLSIDKAISVAKRLGFNSNEIKNFCHLLQFNKLGSNPDREILSDWSDADHTHGVQILDLDLFQIISDWHHYAILELACCHPYSLSSKLITKELGISPTTARDALNRLVALKLIQFKNGKWTKTKSTLATPTDVPSRALRNFHSQMIRKAQDSIESQPVSVRDISGLTIAVSEGKIEQAKKEIVNFRRKMAKLLESDRPTSVYQLNIQFFSLTQDGVSPKRNDKI